MTRGGLHCVNTRQSVHTWEEHKLYLRAGELVVNCLFYNKQLKYPSVPLLNIPHQAIICSRMIDVWASSSVNAPDPEVQTRDVEEGFT